MKRENEIEERAKRESLGGKTSLGRAWIPAGACYIRSSSWQDPYCSSLVTIRTWTIILRTRGGDGRLSGFLRDSGWSFWGCAPTELTRESLGNNKTNGKQGDSIGNNVSNSLNQRNGLIFVGAQSLGYKKRDGSTITKPGIGDRPFNMRSTGTTRITLFAAKYWVKRIQDPSLNIAHLMAEQWSLHEAIARTCMLNACAGSSIFFFPDSNPV